MKLYGSKISKEEFIKLVTDRIIKPAVLNVQSTLSEKYQDEKYEYYEGLCDLSVDLLIEEFKNCKLFDLSNPHALFYKDLHGIHGELRHDTRIPSTSWAMEHTMCTITINGITFYIDPTCLQFRDLYDYMPQFYIDTEVPDWFYPDRKNPIWTKWGQFIDTHIMIKKQGHNIGILSYMEYWIRGTISDYIRKIKYSN